MIWKDDGRYRPRGIVRRAILPAQKRTVGHRLFNKPGRLVEWSYELWLPQQCYRHWIDYHKTIDERGAAGLNRINENWRWRHKSLLEFHKERLLRDYNFDFLVFVSGVKKTELTKDDFQRLHKIMRREREYFYRNYEFIQEEQALHLKWYMKRHGLTDAAD